jgi:hypothetical protein
MQNGLIEGNTSTAGGGGLYIAFGFTMENGTIRGNTAGTDGGGVFFAVCHCGGAGEG